MATNGSLVYNHQGQVYQANLTLFPRPGLYFAMAAIMPKGNGLVVCGGYLGKSRLKVASKKLNLVKNEPEFVFFQNSFNFFHSILKS